MAIRYLRAMGTCGFGESGSIEDVVKGEDILSFNTKVIDLPGPTRNGIMYPTDEFKVALGRPILNQMLATRSLYGEHDHPIDPGDIKRWQRIDMKNTSFRWDKLDMSENKIYGKVVTVPINDNLMYKCIASGELPSVSVRVLGEINEGPNMGMGESVSLHNIHLVTIDWVRYPGNPDSFVKDASSFEFISKAAFSNPEAYAYKGITATAESALVTSGLVEAGEKIIPVGKGIFAVAEGFTEKDYYNMKNFRIGSFL